MKKILVALWGLFSFFSFLKEDELLRGEKMSYAKVFGGSLWAFSAERTKNGKWRFHCYKLKITHRK